mmetsp:Transcript_46809/g.118602  ORF Transcript_46809/g.118602 Transcript_46809/m.118602 type:complete len:229 (-) Transcript_46809:119-805(-)
MADFVAAGGVKGKRRAEKAEPKQANSGEKAEEPKRPQNPYWLWLSENREQLTKESGSAGVGAVGKLAGQKWKAMSDVDKKPYETKGADLSKKYAQKMADFVAAGGVKGKRRAQKAEAKQANSGTKKAKQEARAASGQPKKPPTGFWLYLCENREAFEKEAGSKKPPVISGIAGKKWKSMSDAHKKPFEDQAAKAKAEYQTAMEEWKNNGGGEGDDKDEDEEEDGEEEQ